MKLMPVFLALACSAQAQVTNRVCLAWDPSPSPDISTCRLYLGTNSGTYYHWWDVGNVTNACVTNVSELVTNFFVVTAVDTSGLESDPSNEVFCKLPFIGTIPIVTPIPDTTLSQNATRILPFVISDKESPADTLVTVLSSTNAAVLPLTNIVVAGTGTNRSVAIRAMNALGTSLVKLLVADTNGGCNCIAFLAVVTDQPSPARTRRVHSQR